MTDAFDRFLSDCISDSVNAYPSNHDGTWQAGPCPTCGCTALGLDPTPYCLQCAVVVDNWRTYLEAVVSSLDALGELAPKLPEGEANKARLDLDFLNLALSKLMLGVRR